MEAIAIRVESWPSLVIILVTRSYVIERKKERKKHGHVTCHVFLAGVFGIRGQNEAASVVCVMCRVGTGDRGFD